MDIKANELKVLSIDFDYIMYPCINLYNNMCFGDGNPTLIWDIIERERNIEDKLSFDKQYFLFINKLIMSNIINNNDIKFISIENHGDIVDHLLKYENTKFDILNIDHHHDFIYNTSDVSISEVLDFDKYTCGNWGYYLFKKGHLFNDFRWMKTPTSSTYNGPDSDAIKILTKNDWESVLEEHFDIIFLCLSPQWVPYKYKHLYDIIVQNVELIQTARKKGVDI